MSIPAFRFAPSPNGYLHLGHAYSAVLNAAMARDADGRFLLRIEDIDTTRCRPEYEAAIVEDLRWLGLSWEEPVRLQSEHLGAYAEALERLAARGLVYPSFESRAEIAALVAARERIAPWPRDPDGVPLYPGTARTLSRAERARRMASEPYALRFDVAAALEAVAGQFPSPARGGGPGRGQFGGTDSLRAPPPQPSPASGGGSRNGDSATQAPAHIEATIHEPRIAWTETGSGPRGETGTIVADPGAWGDVVLGRKDTPTSYHLSVVVDDALQGITHVVRGWDLFAATGLHRLLQILLELTQPIYHHHRLILDAEGRKLSKSTRATGLRELRAASTPPEDILSLIGFA